MSKPASLKPQQFRALIGLGVLLVGVLVYQLWPTNSTAAVPIASGSKEVQEQRLARLRETAATVPAKEENLKKISAELTSREQGLIRADSAAQAQAQLSTLLRQVASGDGIELRSAELNGIAPLGNSYASVAVTIQFECHIEQLLNFMASIASRPELIASRDLRVVSANQNDKLIAVRMTATAVVPRNLLPVKGAATAKGGTPF